MPVDTKAIKPLALKAIADHLATEGPQNWGKVRDQFPDVPEASWWRWVKSVRDSPAAPERIKAVKRKVEEAKRKVAAEPIVETPDEVADAIAQIRDALPAAPSPDYIARNGEAGLQTLNLLAVIHGLLDDAMKMRAFAVKEDDSIKNPMLFDRSMERRERFVNVALNAMREVWELRRIEQFMDVIVDEVAQESPECAHRIMRRLQAANEQYGFSFNARV